jgi:hypothetical protein
VNLVGRVALAINMPEPVRRLLLRRLFVDTAAVFGRPVPRMSGLSAEQVLALFREFTARAGGEKPLAHSVSSQLYAIGNGHGIRIRRLFGVATRDDAMAAARLVYRTLGIDFEGRQDGSITIGRCFFSVAYTPEVVG